MHDPFEVLGVPRGATPGEVRAAYRRLCLRYHPDKHAGAADALRELAEERFKEIQAAYAAISEQPEAREPDGHGSSGADPRSGAGAGAGTTGAATARGTDHAWTPAQVCSRCGASRVAAASFGWMCEPASTGRRPAPEWPSSPETPSSAEEANSADAINSLVGDRRWDEVLGAASLAEAKFGKRRWILAAKETALEESERLHDAIAVMEEASRLFPDDAEIAFTHGRLLIAAERYAEAIPPLMAARAMAGDVPDALALLAISYEMTGSIRRADALYLQVDRADPDNRFVAMRDRASGVTRGRYSGGTSGKTVGCGGLLVTLLLFVLWLVAKALR